MTTEQMKELVRHLRGGVYRSIQSGECGYDYIVATFIPDRGLYAGAPQHIWDICEGDDWSPDALPSPENSDDVFLDGEAWEFILRIGYDGAAVAA